MIREASKWNVRTSVIPFCPFRGNRNIAYLVSIEILTFIPLIAMAAIDDTIYLIGIIYLTRIMFKNFNFKVKYLTRVKSMKKKRKFSSPR